MFYSTFWVKIICTLLPSFEKLKHAWSWILNIECWSWSSLERNLQIPDIKVNYHNTKPTMCINHRGEFCFWSSQICFKSEGWELSTLGTWKLFSFERAELWTIIKSLVWNGNHWSYGETGNHTRNISHLLCMLDGLT